jgi:hypothetical protein
MLLCCESLEPPMSQLGQERRIGAVRNISALPRRADVGADILEPPVSANKRQRPEYPFAWLRPAISRNGIYGTLVGIILA